MRRALRCQPKACADGERADSAAHACLSRPAQTARVRLLSPRPADRNCAGRGSATWVIVVVVVLVAVLCGLFRMASMVRKARAHEEELKTGLQMAKMQVVEVRAW